MNSIEPYISCPVYETDSFVLRLVTTSDCQDLFEVYSDKLVSDKANADSCSNNFYFPTREEMSNCIGFWINDYQSKQYVRFAIICKDSQKVIGTTEIFGGEYGVLRIDIAPIYEKNEYIEEIIILVKQHFIKDFKIQNLVIKAQNTPERLPLLLNHGFVKCDSFRPDLGYYSFTKKTFFNRDKGVAYCGLACCVCSENQSCAGCRNDGCKDKNWCKSFNCCKQKGLTGCWECEDFPCDNPMLNKLRIRTFAKFIKTHGEDKLINHLQVNEKNGIEYHYYGKLIGDYDNFTDENETNNFIINGLKITTKD